MSPEPNAGGAARRRPVALFLTGQSVSLFGSMLVQYAVMWYLTLTTKDGGVLALSTLFGFGPQAVISIFGGVWADRHNRKWLIMGADAAIAVATLGDRSEQSLQAPAEALEFFGGHVQPSFSCAVDGAGDAPASCISMACPCGQSPRPESALMWPQRP